MGVGSIKNTGEVLSWKGPTCSQILVFERSLYSTQSWHGREANTEIMAKALACRSCTFNSGGRSNAGHASVGPIAVRTGYRAFQLKSYSSGYVPSTNCW